MPVLGGGLLPTIFIAAVRPKLQLQVTLYYLASLQFLRCAGRCGHLGGPKTHASPRVAPADVCGRVAVPFGLTLVHPRSVSANYRSLENTP